MFPAREYSEYYQHYQDLVELQVEVCDPQCVEDTEDEEDHDPGIEEKPGYHETARDWSN